jgi:hypothetical protein
MIPGSPEHKRYRREIARKHRQEHYDKIFARSVTKDIPKKPCRDCLLLGVTNMAVEAHHPDYKKPYTVIWLCKTHHELEDIKKDKEEKESICKKVGSPLPQQRKSGL